MGSVRSSGSPLPGFGAAFLTGAAVVAIGFSAATRRARRGLAFHGRVAVITGGSRGLGLAFALRLADEGARLVLLARDRLELDAAAERLFAAGAEHVQVITCDVRDPDQMNAAIERVIATQGRVDLIINNAGVIQTMPFEHAQIEDFEDSLRTHFWGPLFVTRAAVPHMRRQGGGRIVNIASIGGRIGIPHMAPYSAGKFALVGFSESIRAELAKDNIAVITATPGLLRTGSHRNVVVRGNHVREAQWFALATSASLTSMDADRAARQILDAARQDGPRCATKILPSSTSGDSSAGTCRRRVGLVLPALRRTRPRLSCSAARPDPGSGRRLPSAQLTGSPLCARFAFPRRDPIRSAVRRLQVGGTSDRAADSPAVPAVPRPRICDC